MLARGQGFRKENSKDIESSKSINDFKRREFVRKEDRYCEILASRFLAILSGSRSTCIRSLVLLASLKQMLLMFSQILLIMVPHTCNSQ